MELTIEVASRALKYHNWGHAALLTRSATKMQRHITYFLALKMGFNNIVVMEERQTQMARRRSLWPLEVGEIKGKESNPKFD